MLYIHIIDNKLLVSRRKQYLGSSHSLYMICKSFYDIHMQIGGNATMCTDVIARQTVGRGSVTPIFFLMYHLIYSYSMYRRFLNEKARAVFQEWEQVAKLYYLPKQRKQWRWHGKIQKLIYYFSTIPPC